MPPSHLKCQRCRAVRPVFLDGEMMLCQECVGRPPTTAYFGPVVVLSALAFVGVCVAFFVAFYAVDFYYDLKSRTQPDIPKQTPRQTGR